jgi:hypothetical protein
MFCPEDCVHIHEIVASCEDAAIEVEPYVAGSEWIFDENKEPIYKKSTGARRQIVRNMMLRYFLDRYEYHALACSPAGLTLRLSPAATSPIFFNNVGGDRESLFDNKRYADHGDKFLFIDTMSGTIDPVGTEHRLARSVEKPQLGLWERSVRDALLPLQGWSVCFRRSEVDFSKPNLLEHWANIGWNLLNTGKSAALRQRAQAAYKREFPSGHGDLTMKEVLRRLEKYGVNASPDTMRRAIGLRE